MSVRTYVVRKILTTHQAAPSSQGCWLIRLRVGMRDPRMQRCGLPRTLAILILDFTNLTSRSLKFRTRTFLISWRGFLQGFVVLPLLHFQVFHHMNPQQEISDGVAPGRLGGFFRAHVKEGMLLVSDVCWMITSRMQSV